MSDEENTFFIRFTPEQWTWVDRYSNFAGVSGAVSRQAFRGVQILAGHLVKYDTLAALADKIAANLWQDRKELEESGHSRSINSKEYAALLETLVTELYSTIDGVRTLLFYSFPKIQGIQNASNERLLKRAADGAYRPALPGPVSEALTKAYSSWFPGLRRLRKELTHGQTGSCHQDKETGVVSYIHAGLGDTTKAFVSQTIVDDIKKWRQGIGEMCECICRYLYSLLPQQPMFQVCGIYRARLYERKVVPTEVLLWTDGICGSRHWFDKPNGLKCPLHQRCLAYGRGETESPPAAT